MEDQKNNSFPNADANDSSQQQPVSASLTSADIESFAVLGLGPGGIARTIDIPGDYVDQASNNLVSWEPQVYRSVGGGTAVAPSMTSMFSAGGIDDSFGGLGGVDGLSPWSPSQQQQQQQSVLQLKQQPALAVSTLPASKVQVVIKDAPVRKVEWINRTWSLTTEGAAKEATPRILFDLACSILSDGVDGMTVDYTEQGSWSITCTLYRNYEQTEAVVQVLEYQGHLHVEALLQKGNRLDFLKAFRQFSFKMQASEYLPGPPAEQVEINHLAPDNHSLMDLLGDLDDLSELDDLSDLDLDLTPPSLAQSQCSATEHKATGASKDDQQQLQASLENLVELICSPFLDVQEQGFQALAQISSQKDEAAAKIIFELAADKLVQGLKNESPSIQLAAASTLANLCEGKTPISSAIAQKGACQESVKLADTKAQLHLVREVMRLMSSLAGCLGSQLVEHCQDLAPLIRRLRYQPPLDSLTRKHADTLAVRVSKSVVVA